MNFALSRHAPYYRAIRSAFAVLHSATEHVREKSVMRQVTISLIPLFGINLFIPRLVEFLAQNPELDINVSFEYYTGKSSLISGAVSPYCSREFLQRHAPIDSPQALSQLPLLHDEERGTWAEWFQVAEVKHASALNGLLLEDGQLALTGLGCSLLREPLVAPMSPAANW